MECFFHKFPVNIYIVVSQIRWSVPGGLFETLQGIRPYIKDTLISGQCGRYASADLYLYYTQSM